MTGIVIGLASHAGARRAGLLCMPNGSLRVRDFVSGESEFQGVVRDALAAAQPAAAALVSDGTTLTIRLMAIDAKLCARAWGAFGRGDRVSLSGKAAFTFDWAVADKVGSRGDTSQVSFEVARTEAATADQILRSAVDRLLAIIVSGKAGRPLTPP